MKKKKILFKLPDPEQDRKILIEEYEKHYLPSLLDSFEGDEAIQELVKLLKALKELK
ncbi:MAG TPA: hypothetical protein VMW46_04490 [Candidatus Desulfaltia sp.]|nr:hypothetical protein [Candidatus Desulfaltia sp.]